MCCCLPGGFGLPFIMLLLDSAVGRKSLNSPRASADGLLLLCLGGMLPSIWWQWLYLLEGLPSVFVGIAMAYVLPKSFQQASFLSTTDKAWLVQAHATNKKHAEVAESQSSSALLWEAANNSRIWLVGAVALLKNSAMVGVLFWTTPIVNALVNGEEGSLLVQLPADTAKAHGRLLLAAVGSSHSGSSVSTHSREVKAVLLTSIPFATAAFCAVWLGHRSQMKREKCRHIAVPYFIASLLFILFPYVAAGGSQWAFLCLTAAVASLTAPNAVLNSLASSVGSGPASAVSLALYNSVGNLGGLVGPTLIGRMVQVTGLYATGLQMLGGMVGVAGFMSWWMRNWKL